MPAFWRQREAKGADMERVKHDQYDCIRLENQICFPLYACAKEVVRQYRKPLETLGLT